LFTRYLEYDDSTTQEAKKTKDSFN